MRIRLICQVGIVKLSRQMSREKAGEPAFSAVAAIRIKVFLSAMNYSKISYTYAAVFLVLI